LGSRKLHETKKCITVIWACLLWLCGLKFILWPCHQ
jgi:hypothetical protein